MRQEFNTRCWIKKGAKKIKSSQNPCKQRLGWGFASTKFICQGVRKRKERKEKERKRKGKEKKKKEPVISIYSINSNWFIKQRLGWGFASTKFICCSSNNTRCWIPNGKRHMAHDEKQNRVSVLADTLLSTEETSHSGSLYLYLIYSCTNSIRLYHLIGYCWFTHPFIATLWQITIYMYTWWIAPPT